MAEKIQSELLSKLNYLSLHFDPFEYQASETYEQIPQKMKDIIIELDLKNELANPFDFTNKLLGMMGTLMNEESRPNTRELQLALTEKLKKNNKKKRPKQKNK